MVQYPMISNHILYVTFRIYHMNATIKNLTQSYQSPDTGSVEGRLLAGDYLQCLNILMRFPAPEDVNHLLSVALHSYSSGSLPMVSVRYTFLK